ncbi:hypothetical protein GY45DRAFT_612858 [Cubamyces sp. BRFM 1775]|nr:hypothetical protein GY45DRAFT_612858 [Cubamyces sp. BRFM 1775]
MRRWLEDGEPLSHSAPSSLAWTSIRIRAPLRQVNSNVLSLAPFIREGTRAEEELRPGRGSRLRRQESADLAESLVRPTPVKHGGSLWTKNYRPCFSRGGPSPSSAVHVHARRGLVERCSTCRLCPNNRDTPHYRSPPGSAGLSLEHVRSDADRLTPWPRPFRMQRTPAHSGLQTPVHRRETESQLVVRKEKSAEVVAADACSSAQR